LKTKTDVVKNCNSKYLLPN